MVSPSLATEDTLGLPGSVELQLQSMPGAQGETEEKVGLSLFLDTTTEPVLPNERSHRDGKLCSNKDPQGQKEFNILKSERWVGGMNLHCVCPATRGRKARRQTEASAVTPESSGSELRQEERGGLSPLPSSLLFPPFPVYSHRC